MKVKNIKLSELSPDFSKLSDEVKKLLPKNHPKQISFELLGTNPYTANAIIRSLYDEVEVKALNVNFKDIVTDDSYVITDEVARRIGLMHIDQNVKPNNTFSLRAFGGKHGRYVKSGDIVSDAGKSLPFNLTHRLFWLNAGKRVRIDNITVMKSQGYKNAKYSYIINIEQYTLDYLPVTIVTKQNRWVPAIVKADIGKNLARKKILIIPDTEYSKRFSEKQMKRLKYYTVIEGINPKTYQSTNHFPSEYQIIITNSGFIDQKKMMRDVCDYLLDKLAKFKKGERITAKQNTIIFEDDTFTFSKMLCYTIYQLDPSIKYVSDTLMHPLLNKTKLNIIHSSPIRLFNDAIDVCIKNINEIKKAFA